MKYICVKWKHAFTEEPSLLYSEVDENRWEHRKVEIYADGRRDYVSKYERKGLAGLSEEPLPPLAQIAKDPQFEPVEISKAEFEDVWTAARL